MQICVIKGFANNVSNPLYQNGLTPSPASFLNGENGSSNGHIGGHSLYGGGNNQIPIQKQQSMRSTTEDELGFDPFQETQKAFAELMASEQNHKLHHTTARNQMNGVVYNNGSQMPPPPPGFVQSNPHMNSFGKF